MDGKHKKLSEMPNWEYNGDICITGIAGKFPQCNNVDEFRDKLMNGVDMVTEDDSRWPPGMYGMPKRSGKVPVLDKFDIGYFGITPKQANQMDPMLRITLELTYEAIVDAGYNPEELRGKLISCLAAPIGSESMEVHNRDPNMVTGYSLIGSVNNIFSTHIAYCFDFTGPSFTADSACASAMTCLDQAMLNIRTGRCDAAIVAASAIDLKPQYGLLFNRFQMTSPDGKSKVFDAKANGYARSESIAVIFIQKACDARRNHATIVHCKSNNNGWNLEGITTLSSEKQIELLKEIYFECKVLPSEVSYVEAHGTGTPVGDPIEMKSICGIFSNNRTKPILVGAVKSNMGHSENGSGLCSITKVVIAMENGHLPGNLHFETPNPNIPALFDGSVKIVDKTIPWDGGYAGVSCFGFGGGNVHAVLKSNQKPKLTHQTQQNEHPRLFQWCGRTESAVQKMINYMHANPNEIELYHLLSKPSFQSTTSMPYRGFTLIGSQNTTHDIQKLSREKPPVWFVFTGMGCQWPGMGKDMMTVKPFAESIEKSHLFLKEFGLDLKYLITKAPADAFNSIINCFVGNIAIQIALVDTLRVFGIEPDGIIGHSAGEMCCAYVDGCFTYQQTLLAAYYRGKCLVDNQLPHGQMAAVGLSWEEITASCPEGVFPACHNGADSVTISGFANAVQDFVKQLKSKDIFVRDILTNNVAFHSGLIDGITDELLKNYKNIIPDPKLRTSKWISTSVPEKQWNQPQALTSSAEYHVNNIRGQVLFHEAIQKVPKNAIVIEIAPHCLLQAIMKRSLPNCINIGLCKKTATNNAECFFQAIGRLYTAGANPDILKLYQNEITFPVGRGVPMVSPLIEWDHSQSWHVAKYTDFTDTKDGMAKVTEIDISSEDSKDYHLVGHKIDGKVVLPAAAYLHLVWKTFAELREVDHSVLPVTFESIKFQRATVLPTKGSIKLTVSIIEQTGDFVISESESVVVTGKVFAEENQHQIADIVEKRVIHEYESNKETDFILNSTEFYRETRIRGYHFNSSFKTVLNTNSHGTIGKISWPCNFIEYMDGIFQFKVYGETQRGLALPTYIQTVRINPQMHTKITSQFQSNGVPIYKDATLNAVCSGGIEIIGLETIVTPRRREAQSPFLEEYSFVPYFQNNVDLDNQEQLLDYKHCIAAYLNDKTNNLSSKDNFVKMVKSLPLPNGLQPSEIIQKTNYWCQNKLINTGLLKFLVKIFDEHNPTQSFKDIILTDTDKQNLQNDDLLNASFQRNFMRPLIDTVIKNITGSRFKIVKIGASKCCILPQVLDFFKQPHLKQLVTVYTTDADKINMPTESDCTVLNWDFENKIGDKQLQNAHLVVAPFCLSGIVEETQLTIALSNIAGVLRDGGFMLIAECLQNDFITTLAQYFLNNSSAINPQMLERCLEAAGFVVIAKRENCLSNVMWLCRKINKCDITDNPIVFNIPENNYEYIQDLKSALTNHSGKVYLVANKYCSGIMGLVNCLRLEPNGEKLRCILDPRKCGEFVTDVLKQYPEIVQRDLVHNVYNETTNQWGAYFHLGLYYDISTVKMQDHAYLTILNPGDLSSLKWIESPLSSQTLNYTKNQICDVYYSTLNFRDVMMASGKLSQRPINASEECPLGLEFSGKNASGSRIMGIISSRGIATTVHAGDIDFVWPVPSNWSLKQAASVPVAYATAYYALCVRGGISNGESILIHSGAGAVGQAAITIALSFGCTVFTTVGSSEKKLYLQQRFPQLQDQNFANSHDTSFEQHVVINTNGQGVNIVLNSLSDDKFQASVRCLSNNGRFLEIGKYDLENNTPLGLKVLLKNVEIHGIHLDSLFNAPSVSNQQNVKNQIHQLLSEGIKSGVVQPLDVTVFEKDGVENAFRFMAAGKHIGKVVINVRREERDASAQICKARVNAISKVRCDAQMSYIIIGGLGGFGLELTQFLINRGAKHIVIVGRSGVTNGYQRLCLQRWAKSGVTVVISKLDAALLEGAEQLIIQSTKIAPVGGIFALAMVIRDGLFENQTVEMFEAVNNPKNNAVRNLDILSRKMCPNLHWFVAFSSITSGYGHACQSGYGYANSVMERVCEQRFRDGLPGLAIQWGLIGDVGFFSDQEKGDDIELMGKVPQLIFSCMSVVDKFLTQTKYPVLVSYVVGDKRKEKAGTPQTFTLADNVAKILGVKDRLKINMDLTLNELGMDSLMGVEIKQILERDWEKTMPIKEIRQLTLQQITAICTGGKVNEKPLKKGEIAH